MKKFMITAYLLWLAVVVSGQSIEKDSIQTRELEEIVIQAIRANERAPVSQVTVKKAEIDEMYTGQDASVVLERLTPSIISFSDAGSEIGNYNQFRLRGIDQTRINVTLNGVPLNDMIDQGVFFSNFSDFGNNVESIQVQRGVGTSTNGVASYGGSVNFESPRLLTQDQGFELQLLGGSFKTYRVSGELNTGKLKNDLAVYSRFTRTLSSGYKDHSGSDSYSFFFSGGHVGEKDVIKVTAFTGKTQNDQSYLPVLLADINADPKTNYNHPNDTDDFEQELVQLQFSRLLSSDVTMNSVLYYGGARGVFPFGLSDTTQLLFGLENNHYGLSSDVNYQSQDINLSVGLHGYLFDRRNFNGTAPNTAQPDYEDETDKHEFSVFSKVSYDRGRLTIYGDAQLRIVRMKFQSENLQSLAGVPSASRDWTFFNPKVGVNYALSDRSSLYTSFGRSGREPTRTDILQGDGSGIFDYNFSSVIDESMVKAEYVNDLEIGYRLAGQKLRLTANYFHMNFDNEISLVGALAAQSYVPLTQNVDESRRSGFELVTEWDINNLWSASFTGSYLTTNVNEFTNANSDVLENMEHIFAPNWTINTSLTFAPIDILRLNVSARYVSESFIELSNNTDFILHDYFVLDSRVDLNVTESISLSLIINNIFDELYFTEGSPVDLDFDGNVDGPGYRVQPPRNFYGMLRMRF